MAACRFFRALEELAYVRDSISRDTGQIMLGKARLIAGPNDLLGAIHSGIGLLYLVVRSSWPL